MEGKALWTLISVISPVIGVFLGWFLRRNKERKEYEGLDLDNIKKAVSIWKELAESLEQEMERLSLNCKNLTREVHELRSENIGLKQEIQNLEKLINKNNGI